MITMGKTRFVIGVGLLFVAALLTLSCASLRMTDEWRDKTLQRPAYKKIMVVALTKRADLRQPVEDEFSRHLKARSVEATVCYEYIADADKISREELARVSAGMGIEAYLVVMIQRMDTRVESYRSPRPPLSGGGGFGNDSMMNMQVWGSPEPQMSRRIEIATLSARLFDGESAKLVWQSTIESVDPSTRGIPRFVRQVLDALEDEKLVP
jgi:hypothetical protein